MPTAACSPCHRAICHIQVFRSRKALKPNWVCRPTFLAPPLSHSMPPAVFGTCLPDPPRQEPAGRCRIPGHPIYYTLYSLLVRGNGMLATGCARQVLIAIFRIPSDGRGVFNRDKRRAIPQSGPPAPPPLGKTASGIPFLGPGSPGNETLTRSPSFNSALTSQVSP